jgi:hypothetical protein
MFNLKAERKKLDSGIDSITGSSPRLTSLLVVAILAIAAFCFALYAMIA